MSPWRRLALTLVRAVRVHLRGQPFAAEPPPGLVEIRAENGELLAFTRPLNQDEIREARARASRPMYRPRRWLDRRRHDEPPGRPLSSVDLRDEARRWLDRRT